MTVTLNIEPALEALLVERARTSGLPVETFIEHVLAREAEPPAVSLTGPEKAKAFRDWASSFPADLPILSLEDLSREAIYLGD